MAVSSFSAPRTVEEAVEILKTSNGTARVLAGGTDLLVQIRSGLSHPEHVVDIKRISEIMSVSVGEHGLTLGAGVSSAEIAESPAFVAAYPGLAEAAELIGSSQIQGRASVGGNVCNASPAADTVPALVALDAECLIAGPAGRRTVPAEEFSIGPGATVLGAGELLVALRVGPRPPRSADAYLRFIPRTEMDIAVVGAGVDLSLGDDGVCTAARVALGAVASTVISVPEAAAALVGSRVDDAALARAGEAATAACRPIDDKRGTVTFRRRVSAVLVRRAASIARERALGRS